MMFCTENVGILGLVEHVEMLVCQCEGYLLWLLNLRKLLKIASFTTLNCKKCMFNSVNIKRLYIC